MIGMAHPAVDQDEIDAVVAALRSGALRQGERVDAFEEEFASYVSRRHAIACSSGTAALHLTHLALIEPGDEVLVPDLSFIATASAVALAGGRPVFCDVEPDTFLLDLEDAATRITPQTNAVSPVHLFGLPTDAGRAAAFASDHGLAVVGDAAQALGARWNEAPVGAGETATTHSFYPTKNLFVGEGGMIATDDEELAARLRLLRSHGQESKYHHTVLGLNYRMTDVEAAIGLVQLPKVDARTERRRAIAARYDAAIAAVNGVTIPQAPAEAHHAYHQYSVIVDGSPERRDLLAAGLRSRGIGTQVNYPTPLHRQPAFNALPPPDRPLQVTERICGSILSIPVHHNLSDTDVDRVITALVEAAGELT